MKQMIALCTTVALMGSLLVGCSSDSAETTTVDKGDTTTAVTLSTTTETTVATTLSDDQFSTSDYEVGYISDVAVPILLSDSGSSSEDSSVGISGNTITITQEGTYTLSGTLTNGQILVEADDSAKIQLILDGVTITNNTTAPIYVKTADKVFITTSSGTDNQLTATLIEDESAETNVDAVIFSKEDLTLNGEGSLTIQAADGNGVTSKDDLVVTSGTYTITTDKHGLEANNSIRIAGGAIDITSGKDGLHASHDEDTSLGYIYIIGGNLTIDAQGDGIDSSSVVQIEDGIFDITTGGGSANAEEISSTSSGMGGQMGMSGGRTGQTMPDMTATEGTMPEMSQTGDMAGMQQGMSGGRTGMDTTMTGELPEGMELPTDMAQTEGGQMPDMTAVQGQGSMQQGTMEQGGLQGQEMQGGLSPNTTAGLPEEMATQQDMTGMTNQREQMGQTTQIGMQDVDGEDEVSTKGIKANDTILINSGIFQMDCLDDAVHSDQYLVINDGTFTISTGDDALHADWDNQISGGEFTILTCYEGIEAERIDILGGTFWITSNDDGMNAARSDTSTSDDIHINIYGGTVVIDSYNEGDGLDSNGTILFAGGDVLISGTTDIRDTPLDYGATSAVTGGTFIATGSASQTTQNFEEEESTQGSIHVQLNSSTTGEVTLTDSTGAVLVQFTPVKAYQIVTISTPDIVAGETYTLTTGEGTQTITMEGLIYGTGNESGGMGGGMTGGMSQGGMSGGGMSGGGGGGR